MIFRKGTIGFLTLYFVRLILFLHMYYYVSSKVEESSYYGLFFRINYRSKMTFQVFCLNQETKIEELKQKMAELTYTKEQLEVRNQKLAEESSYAKGLASAAAVELKALSEEVAKLMNHNEKLTAELAASKNSPTQRRTVSMVRNGRRDGPNKRNDQVGNVSEMKKELAMSRERELSYEAALVEKDQREAELQRKVEESKQREAYLENELANMWVLVAKLKKAQGTESDVSESATETRRSDGFGL